MAHGSPSSNLWRTIVPAAFVLGALAIVPACELLLGELPVPGGSCDELCALEDECGLRGFDECLTQRGCDADGGTPASSSSADDCMLAVDNCADVALCTCDDACARVDECTGSPDPSCAGTCESLVEQDVVGTFQENRCRIESTCEDLALCGGV
jgi:hypothetical protein